MDIHQKTIKADNMNKTEKAYIDILKQKQIME